MWKTLYDKNDITIILGDSTEFLPALADNSVALILSDPPFGHENQDGDLQHQLEKAIPARRNSNDHDAITEEMRARRKDINYVARPIANDDAESANKLVKFIIDQSKRLLMKGGNIALCCSGGGGPGTVEYANWSIWLDSALSFKQMIIYDKGPMGLGWHYRRSYEVVLVATKLGGKCMWYDESDKVENVIRPGGGIKKIIPSADDHPNAKPVELAEFFIRNHTQPGDTVLDPCAGAGWVAEACVKLKRKFIGVEIDPHWAKKMVKRVSYDAIVKRGLGY